MGFYAMVDVRVMTMRERDCGICARECEYVCYTRDVNGLAVVLLYV